VGRTDGAGGERGFVQTKAKTSWVSSPDWTRRNRKRSASFDCALVEQLRRGGT
jgi:hypothetical protein